MHPSGTTLYVCCLFVCLLAHSHWPPPRLHLQKKCRHLIGHLPAHNPPVSLSLSFLTTEAIDRSYWRSYLKSQPIASPWCSAIREITRRGVRVSLVCAGTFTTEHQQHLFSPFLFLTLPPHSFFLLNLRLAVDAHPERFYSPLLACRGQSIVCLSKLDHVDKTQQSAEPSQSNPFDCLVHSLLDDGLG